MDVGETTRDHSKKTILADETPANLGDFPLNGASFGLVGRQAFPFGFWPIFRGELLVSGSVGSFKVGRWKKTIGFPSRSPICMVIGRIQA